MGVVIGSSDIVRTVHLQPGGGQGWTRAGPVTAQDARWEQRHRLCEILHAWETRGWPASHTAACLC